MGYAPDGAGACRLSTSMTPRGPPVDLARGGGGCARRSSLAARTRAAPTGEGGERSRSMAGVSSMMRPWPNETRRGDLARAACEREVHSNEGFRLLIAIHDAVLPEENPLACHDGTGATDGARRRSGPRRAALQPRSTSDAGIALSEPSCVSSDLVERGRQDPAKRLGPRNSSANRGNTVAEEPIARAIADVEPFGADMQARGRVDEVAT